ncbi:hypothetical protein Bbelb_174550 [Branchiostoma belcheri]|nr:hypothetical protein Bbelb_174550 [Branchiostoma belcheri]
MEGTEIAGSRLQTYHKARQVMLDDGFLRFQAADLRIVAKSTEYATPAPATLTTQPIVPEKTASLSTSVCGHVCDMSRFDPPNKALQNMQLQKKGRISPTQHIITQGPGLQSDATEILLGPERYLAEDATNHHIPNTGLDTARSNCYHVNMLLHPTVFVNNKMATTDRLPEQRPDA